MSDIIQLLPDHVANQIAAGEVIQRPASVVKELLENAVDAQAKNIQLIVKDAGKLLIQVIDDGIGMSPSDARLCFQRYATSKIKHSEDLLKVKTKGFRGEAMASITAVSQVEMKTRQMNDELGILIGIEGSEIKNQEFISSQVGTNIAVKHLFFSIPARRKFLKSNNMEIKYILDEFHRVALLHHDIHFTTTIDNTKLFDLPSASLKQRIVNIFGKKVNEQLIPSQEKTDEIDINGFIIKPEFSKKKRGEQFFFLNDRFIKSPYLHNAVVTAFEGLILKDDHPGYFLYLKVPRPSIDVNIHPTKTEVKFENEKILYQILRATVKHSLGQFNMMPTLDFTRDKTLDIPHSFKTKIPQFPKIKVDPNFNPFDKKVKNESSPFQKKIKNENWQTLYEGIASVSKSSDSDQLFEKIEEKSVHSTLQINSKYILCNLNDQTYLVHQNLAHQRILYEIFLENMTLKESSSQQLLFPIKIDYSIQDILIVQNIRTDLENTGFMFSEISKNQVVIKGIPIHFKETQISAVFDQLIQDFRENIEKKSFSQIDMISKSLAKTFAVKTGTKLCDEAQKKLIQDLLSCKEKNLSPFGKKIFSTITDKKIDLFFKNN